MVSMATLIWGITFLNHNVWTPKKEKKVENKVALLSTRHPSKQTAHTLS